MITFVNAKINIGLQVVNRRSDGYHDLQSIFYPVGIYAGTPKNPESFCDLLEIVPARTSQGSIPFSFMTEEGKLDCQNEKNLVFKAAKLYFEHAPSTAFSANIQLIKNIPMQAGMGGGSADAAFTLRMLRDLDREFCEANRLDGGHIPDDRTLKEMAAKLGADCPFFLYNKPAYVTGIGDRLQPIDLDLSGKWLLVAKPTVSISTREAFAGITPRAADFDLRLLPEIPVEQWRDAVKNDFEVSFFGKYPETRRIKEDLYAGGALYSSLTGSGSCIYGIFEDRAVAEEARRLLADNPTISALYLLLL